MSFGVSPVNYIYSESDSDSILLSAYREPGLLAGILPQI